MNNADRAVKDHALHDRVVTTTWSVGTVPRALRQKSKNTPGAPPSFDRNRDEVPAYLQPHLAALRFTTAHQGAGALDNLESRSDHAFCWLSLTQVGAQNTGRHLMPCPATTRAPGGEP